MIGGLNLFPLINFHYLLFVSILSGGPPSSRVIGAGRVFQKSTGRVGEDSTGEGVVQNMFRARNRPRAHALQTQSVVQVRVSLPLFFPPPQVFHLVFNVVFPSLGSCSCFCHNVFCHNVFATMFLPQCFSHSVCADKCKLCPVCRRQISQRMIIYDG